MGIKTTLENIPASQLGPTIQMGKAGPVYGIRNNTHFGIFDAGYAWDFSQKGSPFAYYASDELDGIVAKANTETDQAKRKQLLSQAQQLAHDDAIGLFGWTPDLTYGVSSKVDWKPSGDQVDRYFLAKPK